MSSHNGEEPSEGAASGIQDPPEPAPPTESLEGLTADGARERAPGLDGSAADSAAAGPGIRERVDGLLQELEPQKALGLALGSGILIALVLRWLRSR